MLSVLAISVAACVIAPAASANSTLSVSEFSDGTKAVSFSAASGKVNDLEVALDDKSITVTDPGDPIDTAAAGCSGGGTSTVACTFAVSIARTIVDAGDLDHSIRIEMNQARSAEAYGGDGSDEIRVVVAPGTSPFVNAYGDDSAGNPAGDGNDTMLGAASIDLLQGGGGVDVLLGAAGDDFLVPGPGDGDRADGGPGDDGLVYNVGDGTNDLLEGGEGLDTLYSAGPSGTGALGTALAIDLAAGTLMQTAGGRGTLRPPEWSSWWGAKRRSLCTGPTPPTC